MSYNSILQGSFLKEFWEITHFFRYFNYDVSSKIFTYNPKFSLTGNMNCTLNIEEELLQQYQWSVVHIASAFHLKVLQGALSPLDRPGLEGELLAELQKETSEGEKAIDIAQRHGKTEIEKFLKKKMQNTIQKVENKLRDEKLERQKQEKIKEKAAKKAEKLEEKLRRSIEKEERKKECQREEEENKMMMREDKVKVVEPSYVATAAFYVATAAAPHFAVCPICLIIQIMRHFVSKCSVCAPIQERSVDPTTQKSAAFRRMNFQICYTFL